MRFQKNFPLATITTFRLGGPAKFYAQALYPEEVVASFLVAQSLGLKFCLIGGGSNCVFADEGFSGLVINWQINRRRSIDLIINNNQVIASAGLKLSSLVKIAIDNNLAGLEKLTGIPGTVGGAIVGNAGAYGQTISDRLLWVEIFDGQKIRKIFPTEGCFSYRDSIFKHRPWIVLRAGWKFNFDKSGNLVKESRQIARLRYHKFGQYYPLCAGSFFKNVFVKGQKIPAAILIEQAKLTKLTQGGISLAPWHHNFLINDGTGTTADLRKLTKRLKKIVHRKLGIELEEEVRFII